MSQSTMLIRRARLEPRCSLADILMTHVLSAGSTDKALLEPYANVRSYLARCMDRPAWKRTLDAYSKRVEPA